MKMPKLGKWTYALIGIILLVVAFISYAGSASSSLFPPKDNIDCNVQIQNSLGFFSMSPPKVQSIQCTKTTASWCLPTFSIWTWVGVGGTVLAGTVAQKLFLGTNEGAMIMEVDNNGNGIAADYSVQEFKTTGVTLSATCLPAGKHTVAFWNVDSSNAILEGPDKLTAVIP
jgi:hypothetical protein